LVAREPSHTEVFTAIAEEIGRLLALDEIRLLRLAGDGSAVVGATTGAGDGVIPGGLRIALPEDEAGARGLSLGAPLHVAGRRWGAIAVAATTGEPPPDTEARLGDFTELMAATIANTESRERAQRLAEDQAALRRVATLVAREAAPEEVFVKVCEEAAHVLGASECALVRHELDGTTAALARWGADAPGAAISCPIVAGEL